MSTETTATPAPAVVKQATPEEAYNAAIADEGKTPADDLAKALGFKKREAFIAASTMHIVTVQNTTGETLPFPRFNVQVAPPKKKEQVLARSNEEAKLQLGPTKLKELGGFEKASSFSVEARELDGVQVIVLKPVGWFGGANPTPAPATSSSGSEPKASSSATPTEVAAPEVPAVTAPEPVAEAPAPAPATEPAVASNGLPKKVTPAAEVPKPQSLADALEEESESAGTDPYADEAALMAALNPGTVIG